MLKSRTKTLILLTLLGSIFTLPGCDDGLDLPTAGDAREEPAFARGHTFSRGEALKVLSRNMYLGGNTGLIFAADLNDPIAVFQAAYTVWGQIQATNFPERAVALVDEIQEGAPHLVAIQEIPHFLILDGEFKPTGVVDHLDILMAEIESRGLPYRIEAIQANTNAIMPTGLDFTTYQVTQWISYTDRIAVLVRNDLPVTDVAQANYQASHTLSENLELKRGWIRVSAEVDGLDYHFVSTHLEVQDFAFIQAAQLQELLGPVMSGLEGVTVLTGDLNSDAAAGPGAASWTPTYETLIGEGFQDAWLLAHPGRSSDGLTCCQAKTLDNSPSSLEERIDFVLLRATDHRGGKNRISGSIKVELLGEAQEDRTHPSGLWPSDHAGLLASLKIPSSPFKKF
jgi:endonuclease/exonuclease/phosphatase family metal-dependent hydrolase